MGPRASESEGESRRTRDDSPRRKEARRHGGRTPAMSATTPLTSVTESAGEFSENPGYSRKGRTEGRDTRNEGCLSVEHCPRVSWDRHWIGVEGQYPLWSPGMRHRGKEGSGDEYRKGSPVETRLGWTRVNVNRHGWTWVVLSLGEGRVRDRYGSPFVSQTIFASSDLPVYRRYI